MIWARVVMAEEQNHHLQHIGNLLKIEHIAAVEECCSLSINS